MTGALGIPAASAPIGKSLAPVSLDAEGSNYTRPLREGLRWWGFVQAQYQNSQLSEDQLDADGHPLNRDQFGIRRARLRIDHGWKATYATLELDATTLNSPMVRVRRAEASLLYRGGVPDDTVPLLVLTGGVTDVPFGGEIGESQRDRLFMERSVGSLALFPNEADLGAKLWGGYRFLNYAVAVINGEPLGPDGFPTDPNSHKDIVARVGTDARVTDWFNATGGVSFYTGKGASPGGQSTKDNISWVDANNNAAVDAGEIYAVTGMAATPSEDFERWALGLDASASFVSPVGITRFQAEVFLAENLDRSVLPSDPVVSGSNAQQTGLTLGLTQQLFEYGLLGFRAAFYDPNSNLFEQRAGIFHLLNQTYWVLSPALGVALPHGRIVGQYDFIIDKLARDDTGVPTDARNDQLTVRLQVDL